MWPHLLLEFTVFIVIMFTCGQSKLHLGDVFTSLHACSGTLVTSQPSSIHVPRLHAGLSACRYGNAVMQPAASNLVVKVPGSQRHHGVCIFDTPDETIVQYSVQEAGKNMRLAVMPPTKHIQPYCIATPSEHTSQICVILTQSF